jgi:hypothetical protein
VTNSAKARTSVNTIEVASIPSTILISFGISPPPRLQTVKSEYHVQIPICVETFEGAVESQKWSVN